MGTEQTENQTTDLICIEDLTPSKFLNIDLFRENQQKLAKENPVIEIIDDSTYKKSDASRRILKKGRTTLQNSKKTDLDALKNSLITPLATTYDDFIEITKTIEDQHETNCKAWEAKVAEIAREEAAKEATRKLNIQNRIIEFNDTWNDKLNKLDFNSIEAVEKEFDQLTKNLILDEFQEFKMEFSVKHQAVSERLKSSVTLLVQNEETRLENERLTTYNARLETLLNMGCKLSELGLTLPAPANETKLMSCFVSKENLKQMEAKEWEKVLSDFQKIEAAIIQKELAERTEKRKIELSDLGIDETYLQESPDKGSEILEKCLNQTDEEFVQTLKAIENEIAERNKPASIEVAAETPKTIAEAVPVVKIPEQNTIPIVPTKTNIVVLEEGEPEIKLTAWEDVFFDYLKNCSHKHNMESFVVFLEENYHAPIKK